MNQDGKEHSFESSEESWFKVSYSATDYSARRMLSDVRKSLSVTDLISVSGTILSLWNVAKNFTSETKLLYLGREFWLVFFGFLVIISLYNSGKKILDLVLDWRTVLAKDEHHIAKLIEGLQSYTPKNQVEKAVKGEFRTRPFFDNSKTKRKQKAKKQENIPTLKFESKADFENSDRSA